MSALGIALDVLVTNRADLEDIIAKVGGLDVVLRLSPDILRIVQTAMNSAPGAGTDPLVKASIAVAAAQSTLTYSQETKDRVAAFQSAHGLTVDGIVGNKTWDMVEKLLGAAG